MTTAKAPVSPEVPAELPLLPLVRSLVFPLTLQPLAIDRPSAIDAMNRALGTDRMVLLLLQTTDSDEPTPDEFRKIGVVGMIRQMAKAPVGVHVILEGLVRVRVDAIRRAAPSSRPSGRPRSARMSP